MIVKATEVENMVNSLTSEIQTLRKDNLEVSVLKERLGKYENQKIAAIIVCLLRKTHSEKPEVCEVNPSKILVVKKGAK